MTESEPFFLASLIQKRQLHRFKPLQRLRISPAQDFNFAQLLQHGDDGIKVIH
jgi:hypothetical protein